MLEMSQDRVESRGQTEWTPLACWSLAFATGPPVVTQALIVAIQVLLQAQGHLLVTSTQLPFTPAPVVRALDSALGDAVFVVVCQALASIDLQVGIATIMLLTAPVCGIFGLPFATKSTVTAVGPVAEEGFLPRHVCDHLVQVQEPSLGCSYTGQQQPTQQGESHSSSPEQGRQPQIGRAHV